jgi:hypothetical protein
MVVSNNREPYFVTCYCLTQCYRYLQICEAGAEFARRRGQRILAMTCSCAGVKALTSLVMASFSRHRFNPHCKGIMVDAGAFTLFRAAQLQGMGKSRGRLSSLAQCVCVG